MAGPYAQPQRIGNAVAGTPTTVVRGRCIFLGAVLAENTGAARSQARLWDSSSATGTILATLNAPTAGTANAFVGGNGVQCEVGIFYENVSGTSDGVVWYIPQTKVGDDWVVSESYADRYPNELLSEIDMNQIVGTPRR
jgi:hypothetical protein